MPKGKPKLAFKLTRGRKAKGWTRELIASHPTATEQELDALAAVRPPQSDRKEAAREPVGDVVSTVIIEFLRSGQLRVTQSNASPGR